MLRTLALLAVVLAATALDIGDAAPPLAGITWVKGQAVESKGAVTVVEFWATWCPPCKASIPHLSKLQKAHGDKVRIVGLSNEERAVVEPFIAAQGEAMAYRVGIVDEADQARWRGDRTDIPFAYLVDAGGTVLWTGSPMALDRPLAQVLAGTFDIAKSKQQAALRATLESKLRGDKPDIAGGLRTIDALLAIDPLDQQAIDLSLAIARFTKDAALQRRTLERLPLAEMPGDMANGLAWDLAVDQDLSRRQLDLAKAFIARALATDPGSAAYLDTQARIHYALGQVDDAIAAQRKAVAAGPDDADMKRTLAFYEGLAAIRAGKPAAQPAPAQAPMP